LSAENGKMIVLTIAVGPCLKIFYSKDYWNLFTNTRRFDCLNFYYKVYNSFG